MKVINDATTIEPINAVQAHPRNPRRAATDTIAQSIAANGFYGQIVAQRSTGFILAGNHRWLAAKRAGAKRIPVTWVDVSDDHALRILLADNRSSDLAEYDDEALVALLQDLETLTGTGYDDAALDELMHDLGIVDEASFPSLPDGDKSPFQQMTFTVHDDQAEIIRAALDAAKAQGPFDSENDNSNGNALARICDAYRP